MNTIKPLNLKQFNPTTPQYHNTTIPQHHDTGQQLNLAILKSGSAIFTQSSKLTDPCHTTTAEILEPNGILKLELIQLNN